jgi:hypothetical protein
LAFDTKDSTLSHSRQLTTQTNKYIDNGTAYPVNAFRQVDILVLDDTIKVIEGLVVDAKSGGVGFRNHTAPVGLASQDRGATWTEDLLFIEPITSCVDTNLTLDFTIVTGNISLPAGIKDFVLTDRGGFANLNRTYPEYDHDNASTVNYPYNARCSLTPFSVPPDVLDNSRG